MGRRALDGFDRAATEAGAGLVEPDAKAIARDAAPDEDDVAVRSAHTFAAEREVIDRHGHGLTALGPRHGSDMIRAGL